MARKRQSPFEDLIDIVSQLPWWAGVLFAFIAYILLHNYASKEITTPPDIQNISQHFFDNVTRTLAQFGQYVLPLGFIFGAMLSAKKQFLKPSKQKSQTVSRRRFISSGLTDAHQSPICPKCGSRMILRTAQKGKNAGNQFWGCSNFPKCHSTMAFEK